MIDEMISALEAAGFYVRCTTGTDGEAGVYQIVAQDGDRCEIGVGAIIPNAGTVLADFGGDR